MAGCDKGSGMTRNGCGAWTPKFAEVHPVDGQTTPDNVEDVRIPHSPS
jgi:hypothetical protein